MEVIASFGGADVTVPLDAECRTMAAFKETLQAALPKLDVEKMCLEVGGRPLDEDTLLGLEDGSVVKLSATPAAAATDTLREEDRAVEPDALLRAVQCGDTRLCGLYLDCGVAWEYDYSPLCTAADKGHVGTCKLLLDRGCDIDEKAVGHDATALHIAASKGQVDICKLLLDRGCEMDSLSAGRRVGGTPLHYAVSNCHTEICRLLLDRGCDKDAKSTENITPLHVAATRGHTEICKLLLERGCDKDARTSGDMTPVHYAAKAGHTEMCKLLLARGCAADAKNAEGQTPLSLSSANGHTEVNRLLAEHLRGSRAKGRCAQCVVA